MSRLLTVAALVAAFSLSTLAQEPTFRRLHVVNGTPVRKMVTPGTWVRITANTSALPPRAVFSQWLGRKAVVVRSPTSATTEMKMPDRDVDIGWTYWTPNQRSSDVSLPHR